MGWFSQPYYDKGFADGLAQAKAERAAKAKAEGAAKFLSRWLENRFGALPEHLRQRIYAADIATLESWVPSAIDAPDLQSFLDSI